MSNSDLHEGVLSLYRIGACAQTDPFTTTRTTHTPWHTRSQGPRTHTHEQTQMYEMQYAPHTHTQHTTHNTQHTNTTHSTQHTHTHTHTGNTLWSLHEMGVIGVWSVDVHKKVGVLVIVLRGSGCVDAWLWVCCDECFQVYTTKQRPYYDDVAHTHARTHARMHAHTHHTCIHTTHTQRHTHTHAHNT